MSVCMRIAGRSASAAKILAALCGLAGCTGAPTVATVSPDTPSALVQSDQHVDVVQVRPGQASASDRSVASTATSRPLVRPETSRHAAPARRDPFASDARFARTRTATAGDVIARTADRRIAPVEPATSAGQRNRIQHVGYTETGRLIRSTESNTDADNTAAGVVHVQDHRLPPAAPLGSASPFARSRRDVTVDATPAARRRVVRRPVDFTPVSAERAAAKEQGESPVPIAAFLAGDRLIDDAEAHSVPNEDMIVDSAILPRRAEWRSEILPQRSESAQSPFPIMPRRPFATPDWDNSTPPAATANVPISIAPAQTVSTSTGRRGVPTFPASQAETASPLTTKGSVGLTNEFVAPEIADANPFTSESSSEFETKISTDAAPPADDAIAADIAGPPLFAPAPPPPADPELVASAPAESTAPAEPADAGPALSIASAVPEKTAAPRSVTSATMRVEPVDLKEADLAASKAAARSRGTLTAPIAVGLALMFVAAGAVMFRRRLA